MADVVRRKGKTNRKHGRNKKFCLKYYNEGRQEKNKIIKLKKHVKNQPLDLQAVNYLKKVNKFT